MVQMEAYTGCDDNIGVFGEFLDRGAFWLAAINMRLQNGALQYCKCLIVGNI
jgi:hypothetical protein